MCTLGEAQSTAYPMGKSYALLGSRTHARASAGDPCTMGRNAMVHLEVKDELMTAAHKTMLETIKRFPAH
jgi:hypothetical protein